MNLETMSDQLLTELEACGFSQTDRMAVWGCVVSLWDAELNRLSAIEAAAGEVLASGRARYDSLDGSFPEPAEALEVAYYGCEPRYVGDLVPAAAMIALRAAVESQTTAAGQDGREQQEDEGHG